ncbi:MarR family transcriptional regulator [Microbacterium protaetiae]|uniref:MarR family transcriptional regulator n=1 Tax=Microbacterium protaetiae TaxID=2509458 RepID=A0A4P6E901_9MICO|nr:MarR family transcriptional regulator [Microbacterium protaetiae]QAY58550.1 MarR family transcriptional regulator [Microbacterium protaetiae]
MTSRASDELIDALAQTTFAVLPTLTRIAAEFDLSLTQLRLFGILRDHSPRIVELADVLGLDKSSVSGLVDRAAERGLVRRVRDSADKRVVRVEMTTQGRELATHGMERLNAELVPLVSLIDTDAQRTLARSIHTLLTMATAR